MGSLPMNFYFQKMDIAKLEVSLQLTEVEGGVFLLSPPPCRASPLRVRVRAGRAGAGGEYFPELLCVKETKI